MAMAQTVDDEGVTLSYSSVTSEDLAAAIIKGDLTTLAAFLDKGIDIDSPSLVLSFPGLRSPSKVTPLVAATLYSQADVVGLLLERGVNVNCSNGIGPAILYAIRSCSCEAARNMVRSMLRHGADVNARGPQNQTPLHELAEIGQGAYRGVHTDIASLLLEHGSEVNAKTYKGATALHMAAAKGHTELCSLLIDKGADPNIVNDSDMTPLHRAAYSAHTDVIELLLDKGADIDTQKCEVTPLNYACYQQPSEALLKVINILLDRGPPVEVLKARKPSPLQGAVISRNVELIGMLLAKGFDVESEMSVVHGYKTPLQYVVADHEAPHGPEILSTLIKANANVMVEDSELGFPLHYVVCRDEALDDPDQFPTENRVSMARLLIAAGADVNARESCGDLTPLHQAAYHADVEMIEILAANGASLESHDAWGRTPLHSSVMNKRTVKHMFGLAAVKALIDRGADVNAQDNEGSTPLHLAFQTSSAVGSGQRHDISILSALLAAGADVYVHDYNGLNAMDYSFRSGSAHTRIFMQIWEAGTGTLAKSVIHLGGRRAEWLAMDVKALPAHLERLAGRY